MAYKLCTSLLSRKSGRCYSSLKCKDHLFLTKQLYRPTFRVHEGNIILLCL